jgi:hypothetical protein
MDSSFLARAPEPIHHLSQRCLLELAFEGAELASPTNRRRLIP